MGNFNRGGRGGGRSFGNRDFGNKRDFDRERPRPQMHNAICSNCGKECQVPFKPTGEKPVYCRECFAKMNGEDTRGNFGRNDRNERPTFRPSHQEGSVGNQQLSEVNAKLDKILALLSQDSQK